MILETFVNGRARSNGYLYSDGSAECVFIDPGVHAAPRMLRRARDLGLKVLAVALTHGHPDHTWTSRLVAEAASCDVWLHPADWPWLDEPVTAGTVPGLRTAGRALARVKRLRPPSLRRAQEGAGIGPLRVVHTPGHTRGSACFSGPEVCFVGDTLSCGFAGKASFAGGDRAQLGSSLHRLAALPDATTLLPGHGGAVRAGVQWDLLRRKGVVL